MKKSYIIFLFLLLIGGVGLVYGGDIARERPPAPVDKKTVAVPVAEDSNLSSGLAGAAINPDEVVTLLPPDAIPAILPDQVSEIMVTAAEAEADGINPSVRVLGVSFNGDSRAYPIPFMSEHEIVNDVIGGRPVAVTW